MSAAAVDEQAVAHRVAGIVNGSVAAIVNFGGANIVNFWRYVDCVGAADANRFGS
jgi:hypothetical protein